MSIAIKAEHISKAYQLGEIGTGTLSRDLERWYAKIRGKEDPFLKVGEANDRSVKGTSDIVWSLKDISFDIEEGDAVGVIGKNGAGKSTLLKILSKVTAPTSGRISGKGRIASLLEVGTGFHPELTGKENIYLNGAILGMRKKEITRKLDEIIAFSGVERYIDTPVKRYSSGMYVRLAFAVAAHLESEILVVDEVLAVGDVEFQKKCLGKMEEVSKGEGRTVLFVSHNMGAVNSLCKKAILLKNGQLAAYDKATIITSEYLRSNLLNAGEFYVGKSSSTEKVIVSKVALKNSEGELSTEYNFGDRLTVEVFLDAMENFEKPYIWIAILSDKGGITAANGMLDGYRTTSLPQGSSVIKCHFENLNLLPGSYIVHIGIRNNDGRELLTASKDVAQFYVKANLSSIGFNGTLADSMAEDCIPPILPYSWEFNDGNKYAFPFK